jgi:methylase of polypeptide subunit release factors
MTRALAGLEGATGDIEHQALVSLGRELKACGYEFTTITPVSHRRVTRRAQTSEDALTRVFGWNLPFVPTELPPQLVALLELAGKVRHVGGLLRSNVRFSTLGGQLFVHSAFPTEAGDSVFFGPDTYRFIRGLREALNSFPINPTCTLIDIGCGSGAGGLQAAKLLVGRVQPNIILGDINPKALRYSSINAVLNDITPIRTVRSDVLDGIEGRSDLIISNPPYLVDVARRAYRHGGGALGLDLSVRIVRDGIARLNPGGRLFLYTGTPIIDGVDQFLRAIRPLLETGARRYGYEEIDPDVFGEELEHAPYDRADRIAVIALTIDV